MEAGGRRLHRGIGTQAGKTGMMGELLRADIAGRAGEEADATEEVPIDGTAA
jgi:hypothetical protein